MSYRTIDLPFGAGLDAKTHDHLINSPKVATALNVRFYESGAYVRRPSYDSISGPASGTINRIAEYGGLPIAFTNTGAFRRVDGSWRGMSTPGPQNVDVRRVPVVRTDEGCNHVFGAAGNGLIASVWASEDDGIVWMQVVNAESRALIYGPAVVPDLVCDGHADARALDVVPMTSGSEVYFVVFGRMTGVSYPSSIAYRMIGNAAASAGTRYDYTSRTASLMHVAALDYKGDAYMWSITTSTPLGYLDRLQISGGQAVIESTATATGSDIGTPCGLVLSDAGGWIRVFSIDTDDIMSALYPYGAQSGSVAMSSVYETPTGGAVGPYRSDWACAGARWENGEAAVFFESTNWQQTASTDARCVHWLTFTSDGTLFGETGRTIWNAQLLAKPFTYADKVIVPLCAPADIDAGGLESVPQGNHQWAANAEGWLAELDNTTDTDLRRVASVLVDVARRPGLYDADMKDVPLGRLPSTTLIEEGGAEFAFAANTDVIRLYATTRHSADVVAVDMAGKHLGMAHANGVAIVGAGYLSQVDGERHGEVMQCPAPSVVDFDVSAVADGGIGADVTITGSKGWRFVWVWRDRQGNAHRSRPSDPIINVSADNGGEPDDTYVGDITAVVAIPAFLDAAAHGELHTDAYLELYTSPQAPVQSGSTATSAVDGEYYRCPMDTADLSPAFRYALDDIRDATQPWQTVELSASGLATGEAPLYTNGGVLPADPAPAPLHVTGSRDRVWLIDSEDRYRAMFSAPIQPQNAPRFSQEMSVRVPTEAGELTALGVIGDSLVLFSATSIHMLETIDGPDSTNSGAFPPLREISREVGCINAASVVSTDVGLFFQSDSGIHLVDASGGLQHVGRDVQPLATSATIVGAAVIPEERQVIFDTASASLVFDYEHASWSLYDLGDDIVSSARIGGQHVISLADDVLVGDNGNTAEDIRHGITTGWTALAGRQGFKRIRRIGILGRVVVPAFEADDTVGTLRIALYFNEDLTQTVTYERDIATLHASGHLDPLQLRLPIPLRHQKCRSIKIGITYETPEQPEGNGLRVNASLELTGVALEVLAKKGIRKFGQSAGVTSS